MKLLFIFVALVALAFPNVVLAQWWNPFAPKSAEECIVQGGKTAQTDTAMRFVIQQCVAKFSTTQKLSRVGDRAKCLLRFDEQSRRLVRITAEPDSKDNLRGMSIPFGDRVAYVEELARQIVAADKQKNAELVKAIAREYRANTILVFYNKSLDRNFIQLIFNNRNGERLCDQ